jgi:hypothetical protein
VAATDNSVRCDPNSVIGLGCARRSPGADASAGSLVPVQMWQGEPSRCSCGRGEPSPGTDVAGASPVPAQSKPGPDVAVSYVQRLLDATQPLAALMMAGTVGLILRCSHRRGGPCSSLGPVRCGCPRVLLSSEDRALAERICHHPGCARPSISRLPLVAALAPLRCRPAERRQWLDHSRCAWSVRKVYVEVRRSLRCL